MLIYFPLLILCTFTVFVSVYRRLEHGPRPWGWSSEKALLALAMSRGGFLPSTALAPSELFVVTKMSASGWLVDAHGLDLYGATRPGWLITEEGRAALCVLR